LLIIAITVIEPGDRIVRRKTVTNREL